MRIAAVFGALLVTVWPLSIVEAQCPGTSPAFTSVVDNDPVFLQACSQLTTAGGCRTPDAPTVISGSTLVQEATIQAVVPAGFTATDIHWMALHRNSESDPVEEVWRYRSRQSGPFTGGTTVSFGAPGLVADEQHLFRVSFCDADECFCWSPAGGLATTSTFSGTAPDPPGASPLREVEERFVRTPTSFREGNGDGLGPTSVWADTGCKVVDGPDSGTQSDAIEIRQAGFACRELQLTYPHAWAEILVSTDRTGTAPSEYNIEVYAREFTASGESHPRLYYAKLVHEDDILGGDPHIVLGRFANNTRSDLLSLNLEATGQTKCPSNGVLPLTEADPNNTNRSKSVWLRIEVTDDLVEEKAKVRGAVAWDCASGSIESCNSVCQTSWVEDSDATMFDQQGDTGFGAHHKTHFATHFRAGSVPTP